MVADWRYVVTEHETVGGDELAEIWQAHDRKLTLPLNGLPTVSMTLGLDNPAAAAILAGESGDLNLINRNLKAYRNGELMFNGPLLTAEETVDGDTGTLPISAVGPFWKLNKRLVGTAVPSPVNKQAPYNDGTAVAQKDRGVLAADALAAINLEGNTGIGIGTLEASSNSYLAGLYYKKVAELILELGPQALGGYDFEVAPIEPTVYPAVPGVDVGGTKIGLLNIYAALGDVRDKAVFEYGIGRRNIRAYRRPITIENLCNTPIHLAPGFPDSVPAGQNLRVSAADGPSQAVWGKAQEVIEGDLSVLAMRQDLIDEHLRIRKQPRETVVFTPKGELEAPVYGVDFALGDVVTARAVWQGATRFDGLFRIYGVDFSLDDQGVETIELTLINEATQ